MSTDKDPPDPTATTQPPKKRANFGGFADQPDAEDAKKQKDLDDDQ